MTDKNLDNNVALKAMAKEAKETLLEGRHAVVSQADRSIATTLVRALEAIAYGAPQTPQRSRHHGEDDPTGLPPTTQQEAERNAVLATLTPSQKRALGYPG